MKIVSFFEGLNLKQIQEIIDTRPNYLLGYYKNESLYELMESGYRFSVFKINLSLDFFVKGTINALKIKNEKIYKNKDVIFVLPKKLFLTKKNYEEVIQRINTLIRFSKKNKFKMNIQLTSQNYKNMINLLKPFKHENIGLVFDPAKILFDRGSILSLYRGLKKYITFVVCNDFLKRKKAALMGYGKTQILDLFKRMNENSFRGYLILDPDFIRVVKRISKRNNFITKLFNQKIKKEYLRLKKLLDLDINRNDITIEDIYINQYELLKLVFGN